MCFSGLDDARQLHRRQRDVVCPLNSAARQDFEAVLKRNPRNLDALNNKAQSEMSQGLLKDSQESFFKLLQMGQRVRLV